MGAEQVALASPIAKRFEGYSAKPYLCPAGYPTIGWGHLLPSLDHPPITRKQGEELLGRDLEAAWVGTVALCPALRSAAPVRGAAITDFTFNLGAGRLRASTLRKRLNEQDWLGAAKELRKWVFGGGRKLPGLMLRREVEAIMLERED